MIDFDGSQELTYDFPRDFRIKQNGRTYPYIRLGKNRIRFFENVPEAGQIEIVPFERMRTAQPVQRINELALIDKAQIDTVDIISQRNAIQAEENSALLEQTIKASEDLKAFESNNREQIIQTQDYVVKAVGALDEKIVGAKRETEAKAGELSANIIIAKENAERKLKAHEEAENPHKITKKTVGLDKVDNTADADKPVSKAVKKALEKKADKEDIEGLEEKIEKQDKKQKEIVKGLASFGAAVANTGGGAGLPSQAGQDGKFLYTNGKNASWEDVRSKIGMDAIVVDTLPDEGFKGYIYLVPKTTPEQEDIYDEYIWAIVEKPSTYGWEHIGSTDVDLSGYLKGVQIDGIDIPMDDNQKVNIQRANGSTFGVVKINSPNGIAMSSNGQLYINKATDAEIEAKTNNYKPLVPANLDEAVKVGVTTNTNTLTDAEKKAARDWQGVVNGSDLIPDFDSLTPIETHTFDMSSTGYYEIFSKPNDAGTFTNPTDAQFEVWCRIITTNKEGTSTNPRIYQELDCVFREFGASTQVVYGAIRSKPESVTAATTGIQTLRSVYPKAINSGKQWAIEAKPYNSTARTVTVKVYKTATGVSWKDTDVISTYDTNHQTSVSVNAYNSAGYLFLGPIVGTISSASSASTAGYITNSLAKTLASSTLKNTGYTITGNSLLFKVKGQALLAGIATTNEPIDVNFGVCQAGATAASTATSTYTYTNYFQKHQFTPASSVNFSEAYDNGDLIYARFTLSNGEIYSDDICSKYPTAGHTWYCIGMATSSTAINFDNTESYFFTLDANGKLTHIDGREIGGSGGGSTPVYNSQTNTLEF